MVRGTVTRAFSYQVLKAFTTGVRYPLPGSAFGWSWRIGYCLSPVGVGAEPVLWLGHDFGGAHRVSIACVAADLVHFPAAGGPRELEETALL